MRGAPRSCRKTIALRAAFAAGFLASTCLAPAAEELSPRLVVYGPSAARADGDHDHIQVIYIRLAPAAPDTVYVRILDPDTGGAHDTAAGRRRSNTTMRYRVVGGAGAWRGPLRAATEPDALALGRTLASLDVAPGTGDDAWLTLAAISKADGSPFGEHRMFRLEVSGTAGAGGNVFDVRVTATPNATAPAQGVDLFAHDVGYRASAPSQNLEVAFELPETATALRIENFDSGGGVMSLHTSGRLIDVPTSANGRWAATEVTLQPSDRAGPAAIAFFGGRETPNDLSLRLSAVGPGGEQAVPLILPVREVVPNLRPEPSASISPLGCNSVRLDASASRDPEGAPLEFVWHLGDGRTADGETLDAVFATAGRHTLQLEVRERVDGELRGAWLPLAVTAKPPPVARIAATPQVVAVGEAVRLDGTPSHTAADDALAAGIVAHAWTVDGEAGPAEATAWQTFTTPGAHRIALTVRDDTDHPCNSASTERTIWVNAPPVANAGPDRTVERGTPVIFDGSASRDPDGTIMRYQWTAGPQVTFSGETTRYAFHELGKHTVQLAVTDDSGVANGTAMDEAVITVVERPNAPPIADAGADIVARAGEPVAFAGAASRDVDGRILRHRWRFDDADVSDLPAPLRTFDTAGTYDIVLTVEDDRGEPDGVSSDVVRVTVAPAEERAPVASILAPSALKLGERTLFEARMDSGPATGANTYAWDFGDGHTASGSIVPYAFQTPGTYTVTLRAEHLGESGEAPPTAVAVHQVTVEG